jgi:hypothetical protein
MADFGLSVIEQQAEAVAVVFIGRIGSGIANELNTCDDTC